MVLYIAFTFAFIVSHSFSVSAEEFDEANRPDIKILLEISDSRELGMRFAESIQLQMIQQIKANQGKKIIPDRCFQILMEEVMTLFEDEMVKLENRIISIYAKYFTNKETKQLIAFYETDLGKKAIAVMPNILTDSMLASQEWGQGLIPVLSDRLKKRFDEEGIEFPKQSGG